MIRENFEKKLKTFPLFSLTNKRLKERCAKVCQEGSAKEKETQVQICSKHKPILCRSNNLLEAGGLKEVEIKI